MQLPSTAHHSEALASMGDSAYAFSLTTFSPTGKLGQIEHALQAVHKGKTCLGIQGAWVLRRPAAAVRQTAALARCCGLFFKKKKSTLSPLRR